MMLALFGGIVDALIAAIGRLILDALNALIAGLAAVIAALVSVLPDMPDLPDPPDALVTAEGWVAWFLPVATIVEALTVVVGWWLIWQAVSIALKWAKALGDGS